MADATIKVSLDTTEANQELQELFKTMQTAPGVRVPGGQGGAGRGSGSGATGGDSVGGGGPNIGRLVAAIAGAVAAQQLIGSAAQEAITGGRDELREMVLGGKFGAVRGAAASRDSVANRFGLAFELGIVDEDFLEQQFQLQQQFGAGATTKGTARAKQALQSTFREEVAGELKELFAEEAIPLLRDIRNGIHALGG